MRVFVDASVFIWAMEKPQSNSAALVNALFEGRFDGVVDEQVLVEVGRYVRSRRNRALSWFVTEQIRRTCRVVAAADCDVQFDLIKIPLKAADRLHLAASRTAECEFLAAYDADFELAPEYLEPRRAAAKLGIVVRESPW